ncbi:UdgX family uracil-DNA binding protein [Starkeya sp. ORNL1]|uniref:UdgX family uracil-DNA binding protein n=1 Tax=Starkeya sp. ORNL1 TaxID=2709380 RepID=UPI001463F95A|nr:UdgX family uracil-DNA binding protein [Starkeya sp. ORNL1]QJP17395.1 UdgX family uracil-DNA binding protein [Starkeya sp. ORNL1]
MTHRIELKAGADPDGFRHAVRALVAQDAMPENVVWATQDTPDLFGAAPLGEAPPVALPRAVGELAELVVCHREPERYALLYTLIWRIIHGERALLEVQSDPLVHRLAMMAKAVGRDLHKMHAFVRFRRAETDDGERFIAWFEPDHFIVEATAGFFVDRFPGMKWSILTPVGSLHWNGEELAVGPPAERSGAPDSDGVERGWLGYYESAFNPARANPTAMRAEMPRKYWHNMPETQAIPALLQTAPSRVRDMLEQEAAMPIKRNPDKAVAAMSDQDPKTLAELNRSIAAAGPLVPGATQAVFGEGPVGASIAFVGEQPGDQEDLQGRPFVGPAGQLFDRALQEAGIDRSRVYVTNAVKHFKFELRGKKRIHQKPTAGEVKHYRWWLDKELALVHPRLIVALGATAVQALAGKALPITRSRGPAGFEGRPGFITVHPSYLLRLPDEAAKRQAYADFVSDLRQIEAMVGKLAA